MRMKKRFSIPYCNYKVLLNIIINNDLKMVCSQAVPGGLSSGNPWQKISFQNRFCSL